MAITYVDGDCLHADMNDLTPLKLEGNSVKIMCNVNVEYEEFVYVLTM